MSKTDKKQESDSESLKDLWNIVGHMLDREQAYALAFGTLEAKDAPNAKDWEYRQMRHHIAVTLQAALKYDKPFGEGGRENDPSVR